MAIKSGFESFYNFLANLGLVLRDDPPKVIDMTGREWGEAVNGLELSIRRIPGEEPGQQAVISVIIRNEGADRKSFTVPGWLYFYRIEVLGPDGAAARATAYGSRLLEKGHATERIDVTLGPRDARETDLPMGALYDMRRAGDYQVRVSCRVPDSAELVSNQIGVTIK